MVLELNWRDIATNPPAEFLELEEYGRPPVLDIDGLVQQVRCLRRATPTQRFDKIQDPYLQEFLAWASQKSRSIPTQSKDATVRAFYLALSRTPHVAPHFALANSLDQGMFLDAALDKLLVECAIDGSQDFAHIHACGDAHFPILVKVKNGLMCGGRRTIQPGLNS